MPLLPAASTTTTGSLPSDTTTVRIAIQQNNTLSPTTHDVVVSTTSSGGVVVAGTSVTAKAVKFEPAATRAWTIWTATSAGGPWTKAAPTPVRTPVARPATASHGLLTLWLDHPTVTQMTHWQVQGSVEGVYTGTSPKTINILSLEDYVADVVTAESISYWGTVGGAGPQGEQWGFQALEAQAVAVRSYVLADRGSFSSYATTCDRYCQYYPGMTDRTALGVAAAADTAGRVMVMPSGAIATTEYSSSTGGYTSSSAETSPFSPVPDTGDAVCLNKTEPGLLCNTKHTWTMTVPIASVAQHWPAEGSDPSVAVTGRNGFGTWGGRATQITITGTVKGTVKSQTVTPWTFVVDLRIYSRYFMITATKSTSTALYLVGHGWGHGVGMGQWGAFGYAVGTDGGHGHWTWESILEHYYRPATLATLPGSPTASFRTYTRVFGPTADATAANELADRFPPTSTHCPGTTSTRPVVLATDANYPDALSSAPLARALGTGTLLTPTGSLSDATKTALRLEGITRVWIVGGSLAVSTAVQAAIEARPAYACGGATQLGRTISVTRIAGRTEYGTAQLNAITATKGAVGTLDLASAYAANAAGHQGAYNATAGWASAGPVAAGALRTAIVATGKGFQDAMSASTLAYADRLPILLTTPHTLSTPVTGATLVVSTLETLGVQQVILMGGNLAVSTQVAQAIAAKAHVSVLRVAGATFTQTAVELASLETATSDGSGAGWTGTGALTVARGDYYTDGLAGAVVAADGPTATSPEPLVLTWSPSEAGHVLTTFLSTAGHTGLHGVPVTSLTVLGGPLAVTKTTVDQMGGSL